MTISGVLVMRLLHIPKGSEMEIDVVDLIERGQPVTFEFKGRTVFANADRNSGYVFFSPPAEKTLNDYYQNEYQKCSSEYYTIKADYEPGKNGYHASRILDAYSTITGKMPVNSFELGCAYGGLVAEMRGRGIDAHGSDINQGAIAAGRQERENLSIVSANNLDAYSHILNPVDLLCSLHVLEHDPNLMEVIRRASSVLSEEGLIFVSVPNAMFVSSVLTGFSNNPWASYPQHLHMLSPGFLPTLCEETGFVPLYWDTRLFFATDPLLISIFGKDKMSDDLINRLEFILGQSGFGMELNFLLAPKGGQLALKHAERVSSCLTCLEVQRQGEVAIRRFLASQ